MVLSKAGTLGTRSKILLVSIPILIAAAVGIASITAVKYLNEGRPVPVLMYHGISADAGRDVWTVTESEFDRQMREMKNDGRVAILPRHLTLAAHGLCLLPAKPVLITLDDGYRNNVDVAEPIMAKYGMKGICYLILSRIGDSDATRSQYRNRDNLIWPEVCAAMKRGVLSFGIHSISHTPILDHQADEVTPARHLFKARTGRKADSYCYPSGRTNEKLVAAVQRKNRYKTAMICEDKMFVFSRHADFYKIPRVSVYGGEHRFGISDVSFGDGALSATLSYDGLSLPVQIVLHDKSTDVSLLPTCGILRLNGRLETPIRWGGLPEKADFSQFEVVVKEQNGLFTYTNLPVAFGQQSR